jgi:hypothetical protein
MHVVQYSHVVLDRESGEPLAVVGHLDELEGGGRFGLVRWLTATTEPVYLWLRGLHLLPLTEASADVRAQLEAMLPSGTLP